MILKAMFWQLMDRDNRIRIPHPLPKKSTPYGVLFFCVQRVWDSNPSKCGADERRLPPARRRQALILIEFLILCRAPPEEIAAPATPKSKSILDFIESMRYDNGSF